jgi:hypothetical protein
LPIRTLDPVHKLKQVLINNIKNLPKDILSSFEINPESVQVENIRLRENLSDKLCEVYHDNKILETYKIYDDKEIAIQFI